MTALLLAKMEWPNAVALVGVAWAAAFGWAVFWWALSKGAPSPWFGEPDPSGDEELTEGE